MKSWRKLWFIRHAETDLAGRFSGWSDPPLNEKGRAQLPALATRMAEVTLAGIYASDLQRARQTAAALAEPRELSVRTLLSLREIAFGAWEGLDWDEIEARDPIVAQRWITEFPSLPAPGGEPIAAFRSRVRAGLQELAGAEVAAPGDLAVVTHAGVLRVLLEEFGHFPAHHAWERTRDYTCIVQCTQAAPGSRIEVVS